MKSLLIAALFACFVSITAIAAQAATDDPELSTISGNVVIQGKIPMLNGMVLLFDNSLGPPPSRDKYWRVPDRIINTDNRGRFSIKVPPGTYYLQVAQKNPESDIGPPKTSEYFYFHGDAKGNPRKLIVGPGKKLSLGVLKALLFSPDMEKFDNDVTSVEGVITNQEGNPVENAVVFAHLTPETVGRPTFVSSRSDKNGAFTLRVHEGVYYLKVRSVFGGGPPQAGELQNVINEFKPEMVSLKKHQRLKGLNLKVNSFSGKNTSGVAQPEKIWKRLGDLQAQ